MGYFLHPESYQLTPYGDTGYVASVSKRMRKTLGIWATGMGEGTRGHGCADTARSQCRVFGRRSPSPDSQVLTRQVADAVLSVET
jgi:hypothetical protein